jgi:3-oxoacyl-[acyl-carrier protein] reductase
MVQEHDFSGKVALITGSSRGIGAALLTALAHRGARCILNYVADAEGKNKSDADQVAASLPEVHLLQCDVGDSGQAGEMMSAIQSKFGGLDILINNAGLIRDRTLKKMSDEEWASVLRVNLTGTFNCIRAASAILRADGRIVNMASVSGQAGMFGQANYASTKAGIIALTKVSARELARQNITVNAVAPGFIDIGMSLGMPENVTKQFLTQIPLGRLGAVEEIIGPVLFLCSPAARYITGQVLNVNGGFYM